MTRRRVRLAPRAEDDFFDIVAWISTHSVSGARSWIDAYIACETSIADRPMACGLAHEAATLGRDLRASTFATRSGRRYRVVFVLIEDEVVIVRILGAGQLGLEESDVDQV